MALCHMKSVSVGLSRNETMSRALVDQDLDADELVLEGQGAVAGGNVVVQPRPVVVPAQGVTFCNSRDFDPLAFGDRPRRAGGLGATGSTMVGSASSRSRATSPAP